MTTLITAKINPEIKKQAQEVARELGFSMSALINAFIRRLITERTVMFNSAHPMSPDLEDILKIVESDIEKKKNLSPKFSNHKKAVEHLDRL